MVPRTLAHTFTPIIKLEKVSLHEKENNIITKGSFYSATNNPYMGDLAALVIQWSEWQRLHRPIQWSFG